MHNMFDDKLMARLCVNALYMLYFALGLYYGKWSYEVNILAPPRSRQVVYSLGEVNILAPPHSGQVVCSPSSNGPW